MEELGSLLRACLAIGWRSRWYAVGLAWLVCVAGWAIVAAMPNQYEANARIYMDADAVLTPLLKGLALDDTPLNQVDILQRTLLSRPNLDKLISKTDLDLNITGPTDREAMVNRLTTDIRLSIQTRNLFTLTYRNTKPKLAYDVVQAIIAIFIESKIGSSRSDMENASQFLQQQINQYERQLQQAEERLAEFRSKYIDLLPSDSGLSRLEMARAQVVTLNGQLTDLNTKRDLIKVEMDATPQMLGGGGQGGQATRGGAGNQDLTRAQAALAELRLRYTEQHPDVIAARQRVEALRTAPTGPLSTAASPSRGVSNPIYERLKMQLFDIEAELLSMRRQVMDATNERDRLDAIARSAPGVQAEFANLNRDYDVVHRNYTELLNRRESMRLAQAAEAGTDKIKLRVVDPPQVPQIPVAPKRMLLVSAVLALGLATGLGLPVLLQQFDHSFHSADDLHAFGLPIAGSVSLIPQAVPLRKRVFAVTSLAAAVFVLLATYAGLVLRLTGMA